jgi:exoribonuclease R
MTVHVHHRVELQRVARKAMLDRGLQPEFDAVALKQLEGIRGPATTEGAVRDLRDLLWCSIDNDDSLDLDQLSVAEDLGGGTVKVLIAVADVDALVAKNTPIDGLGVCGWPCLPHAARAAVHGPDFAGTGLRPAQPGH